MMMYSVVTIMQLPLLVKSRGTMSRSRRRPDVPADPIPFEGLQVASLWLDGQLPPARLLDTCVSSRTQVLSNTVTN
jgi:hypothetical protein